MTSGADDIRKAFDQAEDVDLPEGVSRPADSGGAEAPPEDPLDPNAAEKEGARFTLNDTGNGKRLALYYGTDAMVVPRVGWHVWDGRRWRLTGTGPLAVAGLWTFLDAGSSEVTG